MKTFQTIDTYHVHDPTTGMLFKCLGGRERMQADEGRKTSLRDLFKKNAGWRDYNVVLR